MNTTLQSYLARLGAATYLQPKFAGDLRGSMVTDGVRSAFSAADQTQNKGSSDVVGVALDGYLAFHKPVLGISPQQAKMYGHDALSVALNEWAADKVADVLGGTWRDMVPRTVLREFRHADPKLMSGWGALSEGMPGDALLARPRQESTFYRPASLWDALIGQQDRHFGNYRWDDPTETLGLIDSGYAFAAPGYLFNASAFVQARWAYQDQALTKDERDALEQVRADKPLRLALKLALRADQVAAFYSRADRMVANAELLPPAAY